MAGSVGERRVGEMITPNVRLSRPLGEGGMGAVWVADHLALDCEVAVKFIYADLVRRDASMVERFKREASLTAKIKSPHVVKTFDFGQMADDTPFIVMELLDGESLGARIERETMLPIDDVVRVITQTAKALRRAHKLGIVHRDIKPDNLFLESNDDDHGTDYPPDDDDELADDGLFVKILDFGIAKQVHSVNMTSTGATFGTPPFMSPEQLLSTKDVDEHADIWALAGVAFMTLTGQPPFPGETLASISMAVCNSQFTPPRSLRLDLPETLDAWFAKAFSRAKADRFSSVTRLARTFARAARGRDMVPADRSSEYAGDRISEEYSFESSDAYPAAVRPSTGSSSGDSGAFNADGSGRYPTTISLETGAPVRPSTGSDLRAAAAPTPAPAHAAMAQQPIITQGTLSPALSTLSPAGVPKSGGGQAALLLAALVAFSLLGVGSAAFFLMRGSAESAPASALQAEESRDDEPAPPPPEPESSATAASSAAASASASASATAAPLSGRMPTARPKTPPPAATARKAPAVVPAPKKPAATAKPPPRPAGKCNPPYVIKNGVRRWKRECL
jgi:serine/threonine protein kinase